MIGLLLASMGESFIVHYRISSYCDLSQELLFDIALWHSMLLLASNPLYTFSTTQKTGSAHSGGTAAPGR